MGVSWAVAANTSTGCGVEVKHTFVGLPACGRLCGGDIILRVCDEPVNTPEDVVFHWHHAPSGTEVRFDVQRSETHVFTLSRTALVELNMALLSTV